MSEKNARGAPPWDMLGFTRVVADALDDSLASYLRALDDSVSNVDNTRARLEMAQRAYLELRAAQDMEVARPVACRIEPHKWGTSYLVPDVPVDGAERDPKCIEFEACTVCGSLKVRTSNSSEPRWDWRAHYIRR